MASRSVRWLHLSDFHVGKDDYGQRSMFEKIVRHVQSRVEAGQIPDFLFLTGDLANKGLPEEYEDFGLNLLLPLQEAIGNGIEQRTFAIPGNHDVKRDENEAFSREEISEPKSRYFDPSGEGKKRRSLLIPRFSGYIAGDLSAKTTWLDTNEAAFYAVEACRDLKIGVAGVNTAWLSKDDHDEKKLTPGKALLEHALAPLLECDLRLVLGHHPLDWMIPDQRNMIRSVLGKSGAIYLHGHLHDAWAEPAFGAGNTFLAVQCGASFQAREGERWRNGLLWAEAAIDEQLLWLQPWNWNAAHQDWNLAAEAFSDSFRVGDRWRYPLPGTEKSRKLANAISSATLHAIPKGWALSSIADLKPKTGPLDSETAVRFFDGAVPDWNIALSSSTPRREVVAELAGWFAEHTDRAIVGVLLGPGCEGKTTALLQASYLVLQQDPKWRVLRRVDEAAPVSVEDLLAVLQPEFKYLVLIDEADRAADGVYNLVTQLSSSQIGEVHFLLASRDTDWVSSGAGRLAWATLCSFRQVKLAGLGESDAEKIVLAWTAYGEGGLGDLQKTGEPDRVGKLVGAVHAEAKVSEGAFFGALLRVRKGGDLRNHARLMLERLRQRAIPSGGTLADALAYVAGMHAEGLEFLSRPVLAEALNCPGEKLRRDVLIPLGNEAAATATSGFIFTRHRAVAEAVIKVLAEDFGEDPEALFPQLARAAIRAAGTTFVPPNVSVWRYDLSKHFFTSGRRSLAIRIAQTVQDADPLNCLTLTNLAALYRDAGDSEHALRLFEEFSDQGKLVRGFYQEWGTNAGARGRFEDSATLLAFSLADQSDHARVENEGAKQGLAGLGVVFGKLFEISGDPAFLQGLAAVPVLGRQLRLDAATAGYFKRYSEEAMAQGAATPGAVQAFGWFRDAVVAASQSGVSATVSSRVGGTSQLTYSGLQRLLRS